LITIALILTFTFSANLAFVALSNDPIPGIDVIVKKRPGNISYSDITDKRGKFVIKKIEMGKYNMQFMKKGSLGTPNNIKEAYYPFYIMLDIGNTVAVNGKHINTSKKIKVTADTIIEIIISQDKSTISGTLTTYSTKK